MATKLEKDLTRESTVLVDDRNVLVTITKEQKISMKLKGMKKGAVEIDIEELFTQLSGGPKGEVISRKESEAEPMISLYDFRSSYLISPDFPLEIKTRLEALTVNLIKTIKKGK